MPENYSVIKKVGLCRNCKTLQYFLEPVSSRVEGNDFKLYSEAQNEKFESKRREKVLNNIEILVNEKNLERYIFDIGAGSGKFLKEAREKGFKVSGSELSLTAASQVKSTLGIELEIEEFENLRNVKNMDFITMFCVLAHSRNPKSLMKAIHIALKTNGVLYFHTPRLCLIDYLGIILCTLSLGKIDTVLRRRVGIEHKRIYSRKSLEFLLRESGFAIIEIEAQIGYGLDKKNYFTSMGLPRSIAIFLGWVLEKMDKVKLLPRNTFSVYALKTYEMPHI
jgi:2-polyprenyl-3-methyl-5-hydroxy-6-metoxy-1,4-benzoquinol methylase